MTRAPAGRPGDAEVVDPTDDARVWLASQARQRSWEGIPPDIVAGYMDTERLAAPRGIGPYAGLRSICVGMGGSEPDGAAVVAVNGPVGHRTMAFTTHTTFDQGFVDAIKGFEGYARRGPFFDGEAKKWNVTLAPGAMEAFLDLVAGRFPYVAVAAGDRMYLARRPAGARRAAPGTGRTSGVPPRWPSLDRLPRWERPAGVEAAAVVNCLMRPGAPMESLDVFVSPDGDGFVPLDEVFPGSRDVVPTYLPFVLFRSREEGHLRCLTSWNVAAGMPEAVCYENSEAGLDLRILHRRTLAWDGTPWGGYPGGPWTERARASLAALQDASDALHSRHGTGHGPVFLAEGLHASLGRAGAFPLVPNERVARLRQVAAALPGRVPGKGRMHVVPLSALLDEGAAAADLLACHLGASYAASEGCGPSDDIVELAIHKAVSRRIEPFAGAPLPCRLDRADAWSRFPPGLHALLDSAVRSRTLEALSPGRAGVVAVHENMALVDALMGGHGR